jgi:hypothetical protein
MGYFNKEQWKVFQLEETLEEETVKVRKHKMFSMFGSQERKC